MYRALQGQPFRDGRIAIAAVTPGFLRTDLFRSQLTPGTPSQAIERVIAGEAVIVSDNFADRFDLSVNQELEVPTPNGPHAWPIAGVVRGDYTGDQGSILVPWPQFEALWGDPRVSHFNVFLTPNARPADVRAAIARTLGTTHLLKILTVPQTLAYHQSMVDRAFVFTYAIQLLVVAVTLAGILDLLTTEVIERRREIGTLRALGADRSQVGRAIVLEAGLIGFSGAALGTALSVGTSLLWVRVNFRILIGYVLEHHFAGLTALWCVILATGVALAAGGLAARNAVSRSVLEALRAE
jgi:putative ABC transport system permease protein